MFHVLKRPRGLIRFINFLTVKNQQPTNAFRPYSYLASYSSKFRLSSALQSKGFLVGNDWSRLILSRNKYNSKRKGHAQTQDEESSDEEDEEEAEDGDALIEKGSEIRTFSVKSLRLDLILKVVLRTSRKKIEESFYQNRLRVNGEIVHKKSYNAKLNDELDLIKGHADDSPDSIIVGRVKILKIQPDEDTDYILLKAWRCKSLKIDNYEDENMWKEPTSDE